MKKPNYFEQVELGSSIESVALHPHILELTQQVVRESSTPERYEQGGFLGGVVRDGTFFVWDNRQTAIGRDGSCFLYDKFGKLDGMRHIDVDMYQRTVAAFPDFRMVRYHSHPKVTVQDLERELGKEKVLEIVEGVRRELDAGIYSSFGIQDLDVAINEAFSRQLSLDDAVQTKGRYHLLVSPTVYLGRQFSHLNFYDLKADGERVIPIRLATRRELAPFMKIDKRVNREWREANFGPKPLWKLTREEVHDVYAKLYHPEINDGLPMHPGRVVAM